MKHPIRYSEKQNGLFLKLNKVKTIQSLKIPKKLHLEMQEPNGNFKI